MRNRYNHLTRDLQQKAENRFKPALKLCLNELEQLHYFYHCDCHKLGPGTKEHPTCPTWHAITEAKEALGLK